MVAYFPAADWTTRPSLAHLPGCQGSCGILPNGLAGLVAFFNIPQGLRDHWLKGSSVFLVYILDMIKQHETNLSVEKINILFGIPQYIKH